LEQNASKTFYFFQLILSPAAFGTKFKVFFQGFAAIGAVIIAVWWRISAAKGCLPILLFPGFLRAIAFCNLQAHHQPKDHKAQKWYTENQHDPCAHGCRKTTPHQHKHHRINAACYANSFSRLISAFSIHLTHPNSPQEPSAYYKCRPYGCAHSRGWRKRLRQ